MGGLFESFNTIGEQIAVLLNDDATDDRTLRVCFETPTICSSRPTRGWTVSLRDNAEQFLKNAAMADRAIGGKA